MENIGFESAANMREKSIFSEDGIRDMFNYLSNASRVDQEQIKQMETTNKAVVELFQQLTDTNQVQGKKISKLISQIESLATLLSSNVTRAPPKEE